MICSGDILFPHRNKISFDDNSIPAIVDQFKWGRAFFQACLNNCNQTTERIGKELPGITRLLKPMGIR